MAQQGCEILPELKFFYISGSDACDKLYVWYQKQILNAFSKNKIGLLHPVYYANIMPNPK